MNTLTQVADSVLGKREVASPVRPILDESRPMHALVWRGKQDVKYEQTPRPCITDSRDVILKITATTICGSDLHLYTNSMLDMKSGDILGHEFMGIIDEVGADVKNLKVGQRVVVAFDIACGNCAFCKRQEFTACSETNPSILQKSMYGHRTAALYGYSHLTGGVPGGQAEYVRVPFAEVNCLPIPDDVPDEKALYLSDVIPTAYHGCELGQVGEGDNVAIWGLGPIGLMVAKWCQLRKAARIVGIDCVPERLNIAKNVLGIETINFKEQNVCKTLDTMFPEGQLDVGIECVGFEYAKTFKHKVEMALMLETDTADILTEMITAVRPFGRIAVLGVYAGTANHFPVGAMMEKGLTIRCGQSPTQKYWKMCLQKIQSGELDPTFMITHRGYLSDAPELYKKFYHREGGIVKVFLRPESYTSP